MFIYSQKCKVSPLLLDESKHICEKTCSEVKQLIKTPEVLKDANIIIAGPTTQKKEKIPEFVLSVDVRTSCTILLALKYNTYHGRSYEGGGGW